MEKGLKTILWIFFGFFVLDITATLINGKYLNYLELNPIYLTFNSIIPLIILNIAVLFLICVIYRKKPIGQRFFAINLVTWGCVARIFAIYNHIKIMQMQPLVEDLAIVSNSVKTSTYIWYGFILMLAPLLITQIVYWLFLIDHKIEVKS